jgi:hypothetical protein
MAKTLSLSLVSQKVSLFDGRPLQVMSFSNLWAERHAAPLTNAKTVPFSSPPNSAAVSASAG